MEVKTNKASLSYVKEIQDRMREHQFMLCYRGLFTHDLIKSILAVSEKKMEHEEAHLSTKKKVFNVMMECLQNVCSGDVQSESGYHTSALFMMGKNEQEYVIYSGNVIPSSRIEALDARLKDISGMNKQELKEVYKTLISESDNENETKVVIGIIDIAKKTGNKIDYSFVNIDENHSFFALNTSISNAVKVN